jgi:repressor LexA
MGVPIGTSAHPIHFAKTEAVYTFVRDYFQQEGYPPTLRDIAQGCDLSHTTVVNHLHLLGLLGLVRRAPGKARSVRLVDHDRAARLLTRLARQPATSFLEILLPLAVTAMPETE